VAEVRISLLGPLTVDGEPGEVVLRAAKERTLLATLALRPEAVVGPDALIDALWGDSPPASARKTLQTYVSNIRRELGPEVIATTASGYRLCVAAGDVDVGRFRGLVRAAEEARARGAEPEAREHLREAVALWRGDPFPAAGPRSGLAAEAVRLREEYLTALEARLAADLAAGCDGELVAELETLVREHPFRERLWGHLMVALYRTGRQADALAAYQRARARLGEELGLEPGGELRRLEQAILDHDPSLDGPATPPPLDHEPAPARSPVRYAVGPDGVHVAYQIVGDGPIDVLAVPGFISHLDLWWDAPTDRLVRRLASFSRLILFDKRGMGLSDRPAAVDVEHWVADARAVLDAAGSDQAVILGISAGAPTAALFAASHPERTRALIMYGGYGRFLAGDGYDIGADPDVVESFIGDMEARWGTGVGLKLFAPGRAKDPAARQYWARSQTISASPGAAATFLRALAAIDIRHALPTIGAPTLLLHATRDQNVPVQAARYACDLIPGATLVELDSDIHLIWLSDVVDEITRAIETFIARTGPVTAVDRVLATVLATAGGPDDAPGRAIVERWGGRPLGRPGCAAFDGPARAIRCAGALVSELGDRGLAVGAAVHSGECEPQEHGRLRGIAVDVAGELATGARGGEVLVTQTVRDLIVGSPIELEPRGRRSFRGVPGEWEVFAVAWADGDVPSPNPRSGAHATGP
jgi:DNA-binding SARP family transcriptional activator/pimeloyl-ACP methyl ester carboxylesterase